MEQTSNYFTVEEFAREIRHHPETVRKLIRQKKIIALKPGNGKRSHYRIPRVELERMALIQMYGEKNKESSELK